jgi:hypothetical protein
VSQRQLHDQVRRGFSALTRPPRPQLDERIRESLWARQTQAVADRSGVPVVVVALLLLVAVTVAAVLAGPATLNAAGSAGRGLASRASGLLAPPRSEGRPATAPSASPSPSPSESATPVPTEAPTPTPVPTPAATPVAAPPPPLSPAATLPGYSCAAQSGGGGPATMATARTGAQAGYDRFVIQFDGPVPQYEVTPQGSAAFAQAGGPVTLEGTSGLAIVLHDASTPAYAGPREMKPGLSQIREARLLSDAQGVVEWGVGIARPACFKAWILPGPSRLVIDIAR